MKVRNLLKNEFGLPIGFPLQNWKPALVPPRAPMVGSWCRLEPINPKKHAHDLFNAFLDDFESIFDDFGVHFGTQNELQNRP